MSCCWFLSLISLNLLSNGGVMTTKTSWLDDGRRIFMKLWDLISESSYRFHHHYFQYIGSRKVRKNLWRKFLWAWIGLWMIASVWVFWYMNSQACKKRKETLASMCDERARMLQDQFNVSINHIQAMSVLISTFHHGKNPSAIDQNTFARYTERTAFQRPLTSGVAYAARVRHSEREQFETKHGWIIKRMDDVEQTPVHEDDEYDPADLEPSPVEKEYAQVIFAQDSVAHVISVDVLSGKEDRENVLRARELGKGILTAPFPLLKTNRLGVILTFAVYKRDLPPNVSPIERIQATAGYFGGVFDIESLVEKLLQLASKQTVVVNVYDTTNISHPISMYGSNMSTDGLHHVSALNFGDPFRRHEMHCRFKQKQPWPWVGITTSIGILVIALLMGQIFLAIMNRIDKVEDDYHQMMELKKRAEAADVVKLQVLL